MPSYIRSTLGARDRLQFRRLPRWDEELVDGCGYEPALGLDAGGAAFVLLELVTELVDVAERWMQHVPVRIRVLDQRRDAL